MGEIMTYEQMKRKFKDEWVLIEDPETNEMIQILSGKVLFHSKDRDELYRVALELRPKSSAIWYFGEPRADRVIVI